MKRKFYLMAALISVMVLSLCTAYGNLASVGADGDSSGDSPLLKTDKNVYYEGDPIYVTACANAGDYVAIFEKNETSSGKFIRFYYLLEYDSAGHHNVDNYNKPVDLRTGRIKDLWEGAEVPCPDLVDLPGGTGGNCEKEYTIYLLSGGSGDLNSPIAQKDITIKKPLLRTEKTTFLSNDRILIEAVKNDAPNDWVGIYSDNVIYEADGTFKALGDKGLEIWEKWYYVGQGYAEGYSDISVGENGIVDMCHDVKDNQYYVAPRYQGDNGPNLPAGDYSIFRFHSGAKSWGEKVCDPVRIKVKTEDLYTNQTVYRHNERIIVKTVTGSWSDWVGIYEAGETDLHNVIRWYYVNEVLNVTSTVEGTGYNVYDRAWGHLDITRDPKTGNGTAARALADFPGCRGGKKYRIYRFPTGAKSISQNIGYTEITITDEEVLSTDKIVYATNTPITITAHYTGTYVDKISNKDYIGIYRKQDITNSIFYAYLNPEHNTDGKQYLDGDKWVINERNGGEWVQNGEIGAGAPSYKDLPAGDYVIYYMSDDENDRTKARASRAIKIVDVAAPAPTTEFRSASDGTRYLNGVDVSKHNGSLNFAEFKNNNIDFAIIRAGYGSNTVDPQFKRNAEGFLNQDIYIGAYWFLYTTSVADAVREANFCASVLEPYKGRMQFPIFCDFEYDSENNMIKHGVTPNKTINTQMAIAFCKTLEDKGWYCGNYTNLDYLRNHFNYNLSYMGKKLSDYPIWYARYPKGSIPGPAGGKVQQGRNIGIWQCSSSAVFNGRDCDYNYCYADFPNLILQAGKNGFTANSTTAVPDIDLGDVVPIPEGTAEIGINKEGALPFYSGDESVYVTAYSTGDCDTGWVGLFPEDEVDGNRYLRRYEIKNKQGIEVNITKDGTVGSVLTERGGIYAGRYKVVVFPDGGTEMEGMPCQKFEIGPGDFEIEEAASIRTTDPMGLRFTARIGEALYNDPQVTEIGMYLCPTDLLSGGVFPEGDGLSSHLIEDGQTKATEAQYIKKIKIDKDKLTKDGNQYKIMLSLVGIEPNNIDRNFSAMAYYRYRVETTYEGSTVSDTVEITTRSISRSISRVAEAALEDTESGIVEGSAADDFLKGIMADSNDFAVSKASAESIENVQKRGGTHSHQAVVNGEKDIKMYVNGDFAGCRGCTVDLYAKASASGMKLNGVDVSISRFGKIHLDDLIIDSNGMAVIKATGTGTIWMEDIEIAHVYGFCTADIKGAGVRKLGLSGQLTLKPGTSATTLTTDPSTGYTVYASGSYDGNNGRFEVNADIADDEYLVFRFRYDENTMVGPSAASVSAGVEGFWPMAYRADGSYEYFATFDKFGNDYTIYYTPDGGSPDLDRPYGSYNGSSDLYTHPGEWYYFVAPSCGSYEEFTVYSGYTPFRYTIGEIYAVTPAARDRLFKLDMRFVTENTKEVQFTVPDVLDIETGMTLPLGERVLYNTDKTVFYSSENTDIVTVDDYGMITGVSKGSAAVTVTIGEGADAPAKSCPVIVHQKAGNPISGDGVREIEGNLLEILPDDLQDGGATDAVIIPDKAGNYVYRAHDYGWGSAKFRLNAEIGNNEYLVFHAKYSEVRFTDTDSDEGLWPLGYRADGFCGSGKYDYFAVFDESGKNYTKYQSNENGDEYPYGSYHGRTKNVMTQADTWYYFVAPHAGNYEAFTYIYQPFSFVINGVYAITADKLANTFKKDNAAGVIPEGELVLDVPSYAEVPSDVSFCQVKSIGGGTLTATSSDTYVADVSSPDWIVTSKKAGTCNITYTLTAGEKSVTKRCTLKVTGAPELRGEGVSKLEGTFTNAQSGTDKVTLTKGDGYWTYATHKGSHSDFHITFNHQVPDDKYLVIQLKYSKGTHFDTGSGNEGLWLMGGKTGAKYNGSYDYFAVFGTDGHDYTIYSNGSTSYGPYGSHHDSDNPAVANTNYDVWYYMVAPETGSFDYLSCYTSDVRFTIGNVYALTSAAKNRYFHTDNHTPLTGSGVTSLGNDGFRLSEGAGEDVVTIAKDEYVNTVYSSVTHSYGSAKIASSISVDNDKYLVIKAKYAEGTTAGAKGTSDEGLCFLGYKGIDTGYYGGNSGYWFAVFGEDFTDYTKYHKNTGMPCGSYNDPDGLHTSPGEWYYLVAPKAGSWTEYSYCINNFNLSIVNTYAITQDVYDRLFARKISHNNGVRRIDPGLLKAREDVEDAADINVGTDREGNAVYTSSGPVGNRAGFTLNLEGADAISDDEYVVFRMKYDERMILEDGLWFQGWRTVGSEQKMKYFAVYDLRGNDFTTYIKDDGSWAAGEYGAGAPYGSYGTRADTYYYFLAPEKGAYDYYSYYFAPLTLTVSDVYAVTEEAKSNIFRHAKLMDLCDLTANEGVHEAIPKGNAITKGGLDCLKENSYTSETEHGYVHFKAHGNNTDGEPLVGNRVQIKLDIDVPAGEYLVFEAMYTPDMKFIKRAGDEGIWFMGFRSDAIYSAGNYDYFAVFGTEGTDYTIYRESDQLPYGSRHDCGDKAVTIPGVWYYFVAPQAGGYDHISHINPDFDLIIGNVYTITAEAKERLFVKNASHAPEKAPDLSVNDGVRRIGTGCLDGSSSYITEKNGYKYYEVANSQELNGNNHVGSDACKVILSDNATAGEYLVLQVMYDPGQYFGSDEGLWIMAYGATAPQRYNSYDYFAVFGCDGTDYTIYSENKPYGSKHNDTLTTAPDTWYYLVAPQPGSYAHISSYYVDLKMYIADVYAVDADKLGNLFEKNKPAPVS